MANINDFIQKAVSAARTALDRAIENSTDFIKNGVDPSTAYNKSIGHYGRFEEAAKYIDPRKA